MALAWKAGWVNSPRGFESRILRHLALRHRAACDDDRMVETSSASASSSRRGRPGYDQETVLRRAVDLFIRHGYDATSIGDIAQDLGLTKSAIYHHVSSKEELLSAALDEALDGLTAAIDA